MSDEQTRFVGVFRGQGHGYANQEHIPGHTYCWKYSGSGMWAVDDRGQLYQLCTENTLTTSLGYVWVLDKTRIVRNPGGDE